MSSLFEFRTGLQVGGPCLRSNPSPSANLLPRPHLSFFTNFGRYLACPYIDTTPPYTPPPTQHHGRLGGPRHSSTGSHESAQIKIHTGEMNR